MEHGLRQNIVLDDDPSIALIIENILGTPSISFTSLDSLLASTGNIDPVAAFVDVHLGPQSGLEIIPVLRAKWPHAPVIVLTSDISEQIIERAMEAGADDFLRKPVQATELKARLSTRLEEKANLFARQILRAGDLALSPAHHRLSANGKTAYLSPTAVNLLCCLVELKGTTVSREVLKRKVWGRLTLSDNALDRKVYEARKALQELQSSVEIQNVYGQGYRLITQGDIASTQTQNKEQIPFRHLLTPPKQPSNIPVRVLLIEDRDADAIIIRDALRKREGTERYELKRASNLTEGMELLEKGGQDLVLLDLTLPESSGLETFKKVARRFTEVPVLILSGLPDEKVALEAVALGAQDFVSKDDIQPLSLSKTIQYALSRFRVGILEKSALKEKQAQMEALLELKTQFLANMSHEIRTPMNAVIGMTSLLAQSNLNPDQLECVNTIRNSGQILLHLINDILDFSKFQSGKAILEQSGFSIRPLAEEVIDLFSAEASQKGILLLETVDPKVPTNIVADPTRLRQVLINLVGNALKFTSKGSITVIVGLSKQKDQSFLKFEVKDTGIGIRDEEKPRLFEAFNQANLTTTKIYGGTGLGLTISKTIIELMNGRIWFESAFNKGTSFHFELPLIEAKHSFSPREDFSKRKALVFSERKDQGDFLCQQLESRGLEAKSVSEEEIIASKNHDLAIVTVGDPEEKSERLCLKLETETRCPILWLIPKKTISNFWNTRQTLRIPYGQSSLYEKVEELLVGHSDTPEKPILNSQKASPLKLKNSLLIAEDNPVNQRVIQRLLEKLEIRSDVASNGLEAIKALERGKYDGILMDCSMPEMDGWTATQEIRKKGNQIPIFAMTANAFKEDRDRCLAVGMNEYLAKPVTLETLYGLLSRFYAHQTASVSGGKQSSHLQTLNRAKLNQINAIGETESDDFLTELKELFIVHAPATYEEVLKLLQQNDAGRLRSQAHRLKGLAANLAAEKLTEVCAQIEECAAKCHLEEAKSRTPVLIEEWKSLMDFLENDLAKVRGNPPRAV